jgi:hypothetical protein
MRCFLLSLANTSLIIMMAFFIGAKICLFHQAYTTMANRLENEKWLRTQCADPTFFSHMKTHTSLCEEVENTAKIGAMWFALAEVSESLPLGRAWVEMKAISWPISIVIAVVLVFFPSLIVGLLRQSHSSLPFTQPDYATLQPRYPILKGV